jgi:hypothetical protein
VTEEAWFGEGVTATWRDVHAWPLSWNYQRRGLRDGEAEIKRLMVSTLKVRNAEEDCRQRCDGGDGQLSISRQALARVSSLRFVDAQASVLRSTPIIWPWHEPKVRQVRASQQALPLAEACELDRCKTPNDIQLVVYSCNYCWAREESSFCGTGTLVTAVAS